jgi:hypothetical protein
VVAAAIDLSPPAEFLAQFKPQRVDDSDFASTNASFAALIKQHDVHLGAQAPDVRATIEADLKAAGVPLQPGGVVNFTDRAQIEAAVEVFKKHALMPPDATIK